MTAPDVNADVRARFEAWATDEGYAVDRYKDSYQAADTRNAWWGFQAAHADMAGDPRSESGSAEEVAQWLYANGFREAAATIRNQLDVRNQRIADLSGEVRELVEALKLAVRQNEHDMLMTGEELRTCATALAKHTHQEKP